ncbi:hypothetical protein ACIGDM_07020 [Rothia koreensis]|uniref:hypothetical protein n=1 Tax=Actinomycetes TaxID=1760 RepID=UPI001E5D61B2|nr:MULTISPECIES: hypothetical protein [Actinomycetes]
MPRLIAGQGSFVVWPGDGVEDRRDRLGWFEGGLVVVIDGDAVEQCPVEHPPFGGFGLRVHITDVGEEAEDRVEPDLRVVVGRCEGVEPAGDGVEARADAVLFGFEQVDGDRVGVVGLEELDLFGFKLDLLSFEEGPFIAG